MHRALPALLPADFPRLDDLAFDLRIQAFAIAVSIAAGLGCGLLPALHVGAQRRRCPRWSKTRWRRSAAACARARRAARALIMTGQVAIASVLLVGALLLVPQLRRDDARRRRLRRRERADGAARSLPDGDFARAPAADRRPDRGAPRRDAGRVAAAATDGACRSPAARRCRRFRSESATARVQVQTGARQVSAGYFAALGPARGRRTRVHGAGRTGATGVVIVNREFSRKYLDGRALGWTLPGSASDTPDRPSIVGVVDDTARQSVTDTPQPEIYFPMAQGRSRRSDINSWCGRPTIRAPLVPALRADRPATRRRPRRSNRS